MRELNYIAYLIKILSFYYNFIFLQKQHLSMQIGAQKDNNENIMRINMTNMIYIGQDFMYILKGKKPLLFMKIGAL